MNSILSKLPQKSLFLLLDDILEIIPNRKCISLKKILETDFYFKGHFPDFPIVPGCILIEIMAQTAEVMLLCQENISSRNITKVYLLQVINAMFYIPVNPGANLIIEANYSRTIGNISEVEAVVFDDQKKVAKCTLRVKLGD